MEHIEKRRRTPHIPWYAVNGVSPNESILPGSVQLNLMFTTARCVNRLSSTILLKDTTEQAINEYVKNACTEYYEIPPGFEFRGVTIVLKKPMLVGLKIKKRKILLPFVKPCFGPMLLEVKAEDGDFEVFRKMQENSAT